MWTVLCLPVHAIGYNPETKETHFLQHFIHWVTNAVGGISGPCKKIYVGQNSGTKKTNTTAFLKDFYGKAGQTARKTIGVTTCNIMEVRVRARL